MIYEVGLAASYHFKKLLLISVYPLQILEIPPLIVVSMNWSFSISEISFKLTSGNLYISSQLQPGVDK